MKTGKMLLLAIVASSLFSSRICSQGLSIGSTVPDVKSENVINHSKTELALSDIKAKWILLDFWATTCASCVASFHKFDELQKKFGSAVQVIFINKETKAKTVAFFEKKTRLKKASVPYITGDSAFANLFPHDRTPYYVLLDSARNVVSFPQGEYIREENFEQLVMYGKVNFGNYVPRKRMPMDKTLLNLSALPDPPKAEEYFILTRNIKGLADDQYDELNSEGYPARVVLAGMSVERMLRIIFERITGKFLARGAVLVETEKKSIISEPDNAIKKLEWGDKNYYCVDMKVQPHQAPDLFHNLKSNLERHFGLEISIEKRRIPCLVLKRGKNFRELSSKGGKRQYSKSADGKYISLINQPFSRFFILLSTYFEALDIRMPFVDETVIAGNIDITFDATFFEKFQQRSIEQVKKSLAECGLEIVEKEALTDVMVIRDKK